MSEDQHVVPLPAGNWGVKAEGSDDYTDVFDSKADAIDAASSIARREGVDLIVHGKGGQPFLSPPGSTLDDIGLRHAIRSLGPAPSSGRASGAGKSASRKSQAKSAKKSGGARKSAARGGAKKSAAKAAGSGKSSAKKSSKSSAKKSAARKAKSSKPGARASGRGRVGRV